MPEVADVFRRFAGRYLEAHGAAMLPSHRRAIADLLACRTEALGGQLWGCDDCGIQLHVFHSCRNRACPKCHSEQTRAWLEQRRAEMLPVPYFHVTVTVPEELRSILRRHQVDGYGTLMKTTAGAIIDLARDPRWVGGTVGVLAVLHTWTQRLVFHPHVHCLVTGGGLSDDGMTWHPAGKAFLFPKSALATLVRARFRDAFARLCPEVALPHHVWHIPWVVHITPWGAGQQAALDYLARYAFRIAITNNRILSVTDASVSFRYTDRATGRRRRETVSGHEFIRRFLQHVLPAGFHKVRYYGLWHAARRRQADNLRNTLLLEQPTAPPNGPAVTDPAQVAPSGDPQDPPLLRRCPHCQSGHLALLRQVSPARPQGP
ncbi:MAG TPA: IS91 family transposase [Stellaceae bacterium]|nr:IS91 family transposase [Stellaceae bacterium]